MTTPGRSAATAALFTEYLSSGSRAARNEIVELHRDVAEFYAKRYANRGVALDDLRQVALLGMVRSVDRFRPDVGVEFATFAGQTIDGELKRYFRDRTWSVRPPRRAQELHLAIRRVHGDLAQRFGRSPTIAELAQELGEPVDAVLEAMEAGDAHDAASLDKPESTNESDDSFTLADRALGTSEPGYGRAESRLLVRELLDSLDEDDRLIIELRFFENWSQEAIAKRVGLSQSYLSRVIRRVLRQLREQVGDEQAGVLQ